MRQPAAPLILPVDVDDAPRSAAAARGTHYPALDGLRGLAVLGVMFFHFTKAPAVPSALGNLLVLASRAGWVGVDLFFVLSGFLITGILLDAKGGSGYFKNFYARRSLRIFPLYYGVLALFFLLGSHVSHFDGEEVADAVHRQGWYWLYGTNALFAFDGDWICEPLSHFWSLAVEEHFYLLWPAVVFFASRRTLAWICVYLIAGAFTIRCAFVLCDFGPFYSHLLTPSRMDALAVGGLLAALARNPGGISALVKPAKIVAAVAAACLLTIYTATHDLSPRFAIVRTIGFTLLAALFAAVIVLGIAARPEHRTGRLLHGRTLRFLGKYSYALYVFHPLLVPSLRRWVPADVLATRIGALPGLLVHLAACVAMSVGVAYGSWHLYEKHFLKLKRFFEYHPPMPSSPPTPKNPPTAPLRLPIVPMNSRRAS